MQHLDMQIKTDKNIGNTFNTEAPDTARTDRTDKSSARGKPSNINLKFGFDDDAERTPGAKRQINSKLRYNYVFHCIRDCN